MYTKRSGLRTLIEMTEASMANVGHSQFYIKKSREIWRQFEVYSNGRGKTEFDPQLINEFVESNGRPYCRSKLESSSPSTKMIKLCALRKLAWVYEFEHVTRLSNDKTNPCQ